MNRDAQSTMIIGVSSARTRYLIRTSTGEYFVRCGADLLLNGLRNDLEAEGRCPVCEATIRFQIRNKRVDHLRPETSILHVVEIQNGGGKIGIECEGSPIFDRENCLHAWLNNYRGRRGSIFKPDEFLDRMKAVREPHS